MKENSLFIILISIIFISTNCEKEEYPEPGHWKGEDISFTVTESATIINFSCMASDTGIGSGGKYVTYDITLYNEEPIQINDMSFGFGDLVNSVHGDFTSSRNATIEASWICQYGPGSKTYSAHHY